MLDTPYVNWQACIIMVNVDGLALNGAMPPATTMLTWPGLQSNMETLCDIHIRLPPIREHCFGEVRRYVTHWFQFIMLGHSWCKINGIIMVVAYDLAPKWCQVISNHHADLTVCCQAISLLFQGASSHNNYTICITAKRKCLSTNPISYTNLWHPQHPARVQIIPALIHGNWYLYREYHYGLLPARIGEWKTHTLRVALIRI